MNCSDAEMEMYLKNLAAFLLGLKLVLPTAEVKPYPKIYEYGTRNKETKK